MHLHLPLTGPVLSPSRLVFGLLRQLARLIGLVLRGLCPLLRLTGFTLCLLGLTLRPVGFVLRLLRLVLRLDGLLAGLLSLLTCLVGLTVRRVRLVLNLTCLLLRLPSQALGLLSGLTRALRVLPCLIDTHLKRVDIPKARDVLARGLAGFLCHNNSLHRLCGTNKSSPPA